MLSGYGWLVLGFLLGYVTRALLTRAQRTMAERECAYLDAMYQGTVRIDGGRR